MINVMKQVKQPKKRIRKKKIRKQQPIINKQKPYEIFNQYTPEQLFDGMNNFIVSMLDNDRKKKDNKIIRIFNILRSSTPWPTLIKFFEEFNESPDYNLITFFKKFNVEDKKEMKILLKRRRAKPLNIISKLPATDLNQLIKKLHVPTEINKVRRDFLGGEILSNCEINYRNALWMYKFTDKPIKGFALNINDPKWTIPRNIVQDGTTWYFVNKPWYKAACEKSRDFIFNHVGYVTHSNIIIIETMDMYQASKIKEVDIDIKFQPITNASLTAARNALTDESLLPSTFTEEIVASLPNENNYEMAHALSKIIVFLRKLIKEPQIHHQRIKNNQYLPSDYVELDKYIMLPEVYKNPNAEWDEFDQIIKKKRIFIETLFYADIQKKKIGKLPPKYLKYANVNVPSSCLKFNNTVYYNDDDQMYCFEYEEILGQTVNPHTGRPFSNDFLKELKRLHITSNSNLKQKEDVPIVKIKSIANDIELAPGLFEKLRDEISTLEPNYCSECNVEFFASKYNSLKGKQKVQFCTRECMEKYKF